MNSANQNKTLVVTLVGKQTVPNVLFIKEFGTDHDHLFICTEKFKKYAGIICKAAGVVNERVLPNLIVDADNIFDVNNKLLGHKDIFETYGTVHVNITGGTKIMSLAVFTYFSYTRNIWYVPLNKNQILNIAEEQSAKPIKSRLSVQDYLACCNLFVDNKDYTIKYEPAFSKEIVENFYTGVMSGFIKKDLLETIRIYFRATNAIYKKNYDNNKITIEKVADFNRFADLINSIGLFEKIETKISKKIISFITGDWFELWCYYNLAELKVDSIAFSLYITHKNSDEKLSEQKNEIDLVFTCNNKLYIVECKSDGLEEKELLDRTVHLSAALRNNFGLTVQSVISTNSWLNEKKEEKVNVFDSILIDFDEWNAPNWREIIRNKLNL
jgi:hypothetical protein